jgi:glycosyltransferase involved in cell wall biosynthesis
MTPRLSVVIPTYERRDVVGEAVASALDQTLADVEVIVVDDGSTDGTAERLAERFRGEERLRVLRQENGGTASARNRGVEAARGDLVSFLDSDDLYLPRFAERHDAALRAHPEADLALSDVRYGGGWKPSWTTVFARGRPPTSIQAMLDGGWAPTNGWALRTSVARALRFDPASFLEDTELLFRFFASGRRAVVIEEPLAVYRRLGAAAGAAQKSADASRRRAETLALQERFAGHAKDPAAHALRLHRRWAKHLLQEGRPREARPHALAWWKARPLSPRATWSLLRAGLGAAR